MANTYKCPVCGREFNTKSNMTRHKLTHQSEAEKRFACDKCGQRFNLKQGLDRHVKVHQKKDNAPIIRFFESGVSILKATDAANSYAKFAESTKIVVNNEWMDPVTAEATAKAKAGEEWRGEVHITFGRYINKSFRWLLQNDVGYVKWLLGQHATTKEFNPLNLWIKETLWQFAEQFPAVMHHVPNIANLLFMRF